MQRILNNILGGGAYLFFYKGKTPQNMSTRKCVKWRNVTFFWQLWPKDLSHEQKPPLKRSIRRCVKRIECIFFLTIVTREISINFLMVALVCHLRKERVNHGKFCEMPKLECKRWQNWFHLHQFCWQHIRMIAKSLANMFMVAIEIGKK